MKFEMLGLGTAVPENYLERDEAAALATENFCETKREQNIVTAMYKMSGVSKRHSVLLRDRHLRVNGPAWDMLPYPDTPQDPGPGVGRRMEVYEERAVPLAVEAGRQALDAAALSPSDVTHVVTVTCSGFYAPGVDVRLIQDLGLPAATQRTQVGFMGCQGALNGIRVAQGFAMSDPDAVVLLCAVELCSIHYAYGFHSQRVVANALFADGAAAAVGAARDEGEWPVAGTGACLVPDSEDAMTWRIRDNGFLMELSPKVPSYIEQFLRPWAESWLEPHGLCIDDIASWAVHPGGPRVLTAVQTALDLPKSALEPSREVLWHYGNMSSPTVLFVLNELRSRGAPLPCVALAFGPGLTIEGVLFA